MQQFAVSFILLQSHCTCFGCPPHPSSGVLKTVSVASGTGHTVEYKDWVEQTNKVAC